MKRIVTVILFAVLLLGVLASCGTTPAETTPTPTTPAPTTPAPTTPAVTTPATTTPPDPPAEGSYFSATLKGRVLTLTGPDRTITRDFNDLEHIGFTPSVYLSSTFPADIVFAMGDTTSTEESTVSWADLDGILEEMFGVAPSANTEGPKIAVEVVPYMEMLALANSFQEYQEEDSILFFWDPAYKFQGYPVAIYPNGRMAFCIDGVCYMTVRLDPTEPFWRDKYFYGVGHTVDREALEEHLSWHDPEILIRQKEQSGS